MSKMNFWKGKKSKVLSTLLCATTMAAFYSAPVMAGYQKDDRVDGGNMYITFNEGAGEYEGNIDENSLGIFNAAPGTLAKITGTIALNGGLMAQAISNSNVDLTVNKLSVGSNEITSTTIESWNKLVENNFDQDVADGLYAKKSIEDDVQNISYADGTTTIAGKVIASGVTMDNGILSIGDTKIMGAGFVTNGMLQAANGNFFVSVDEQSGSNFRIAGSGEIAGIKFSNNGFTTGKISLTEDSITLGSSDLGTVIGDGTVNAAKGGYMGGVTLRNGIVDAQEADFGNIKIRDNKLYSANGKFVISENGYLTANNGGKIGDVEINSGLIDGVDVSELSDATEVINKNVAGITREGETTIIEKNTRIDGNGLKVGNNVEIGTDGRVYARQGDAIFNFDKDNIGLSNGNNSVFVGNNSITLDGSGTALKLTHDGLDYADGSFTVRNDGTVKALGSMTADDFVAGDYKLTEIGANVDDLLNSTEVVNKNVAGITREGETTIIEKNTRIDGNGLKVGNNVEIGTDGRVYARQGDAIFNFDKDNIGLSNGNNSVFVGNNSITLDGSGTALKLTHDGLDYADGSFTVRNDGTVKALGSMTADDFVVGDYKLTEIGANVAGIVREDGVTSIEGALSVSKDAVKANVGGSYVNIDADRITMQNSGNYVNVGKETVSLQSNGNLLQVTEDGTKFKADIKDGETIIKGGTITADNIIVGDTDLGEIIDTTENIANKVTDIEYADGVTSIADRLHVSEDKIDFGASESINFTYKGEGMTLGGLLNDIEGMKTDIGNLQNDVEDLKDKTQHITADESGTNIEGDVNVSGDITGDTGDIDGAGDLTIAGDGSFGGNLDVEGSVTASSANIGGVTIEDGKVIAGNTTIADNGITTDKVTVGNTTIDKENGIQVGSEDKNVSVSDNDVVIHDKNRGEDISLSQTSERVGNLEQGLSDMNSRINDVEDRIDKVGAMAAAIANLRTMGYDPTAPTEIAIGLGQYKSETGAALGFFHYPNKNFMLSLSVSTAGGEVMGGVGATWKFGTKSVEKVAEEQKEQSEKLKIAKAESMKKAAQEARVKAQRERHAKIAEEQAERVNK